jgi:hypothetical protein
MCVDGRRQGGLGLGLNLCEALIFLQFFFFAVGVLRIYFWQMFIFNGHFSIFRTQKKR